METKFKVGDIIEITEVGESSVEYFSVGDIGKIIECNEKSSYYVDFNNQNNKNVNGEGKWFMNNTTPKDFGAYAQFKLYQEKTRFHDAQVGDEVYCRLYGDGTIINIHKTEEKYRIVVEHIKENDIRTYTYDGKYDTNHEEPILFYRKGSEKYLTERPEPEYDVDWAKVPRHTFIKCANREIDLEQPYSAGYFVGYFPELEKPFWAFEDSDKDTATGYRYCELAEPCKPEWRK